MRFHTFLQVCGYLSRCGERLAPINRLISNILLTRSFNCMQYCYISQKEPPPHMRNRVSKILPLLFVVLFSAQLRAQDVAAITGVITDPAGALIPDAVVILE